MNVGILHLYRSPGHDFKGRHGQERENHVMEDCDECELVAGSGIAGDRYFDFKPDFKGQITFFDAAVHEEVKERFSLPDLEAWAFRRNVITSGIDLNELIGRQFAIGDLVFTGSEEARPCYWMDEACAPGVEEFLRGKGGLRARILKGGVLRTGSHKLSIEPSAENE